MGRKNKWDSLINLEVQENPNGGNHFSSYELEWTPIGDDSARQIDRCAAIPLDSLLQFVKGEGLLDGTETSFIRKRHMEYELTEPTDHSTKMFSSYHCAFGPQDKRNAHENVHENAHEKKKRIRRWTQKRGCQAHFNVRVMYGRLNVALITYNDYIHQDVNGEFCHGKDDPSADPRSSIAPRLSNECKSYIESLLLMGVGIDTICEQHYLDSSLTKLLNKRDTYLLRRDVLNAWKRVRSLHSQKNEDDAKGVCLWHVEEKDNFFYYKTPNDVENIPFIIGIQTPWMREMMVKHSHGSIIAMDSTFSTNKYGYELYTLLVFDEQEAGVPIPWAISSRNKIEDINEWLTEIYKRGKEYKEDWHVNTFMTDDASAEIEAIRSSFDCQVLLCIWHVRRAWLKNVYRFVSNRDVGTKMFNRLGEIMYTMSDNKNITTHLLENFIEEFKEEKNFIEYFQETWCHNERRIEMWAKNFRSFSHANQETNAAIESYHFHIKSRYLSDRSKKCTRRMDWLIHTLLHRVEPYYKNKRYLQLSGFLTNFKKERRYITSLERSKTIPDTDCYPHDLLPDTYKIRSQTDPTKWYLVRKFGSDLHVCDCQWAKRGNMCKHVLKILDLVKKNKINQQDQIGADFTSLVDKNDEVRGSSSHENNTIDGCIPLEDQDVLGVVNGEAQSTDDVIRLVDENHEVRGSSCYENYTIDGCIPSEDQDVHGVVISEAQSIDGSKSSNTSNDNFQNSVDYITSLLQNLPTREDEKNMFSECVERLKKDIHATFSSSSKFKSIPGSENISMRRISPWFSPSKMRKCHFTHRKCNAISQNSNERAKEYPNFQFPSIRSRKQKKKKVINRSGITIQEERDVIRQKGLNDQENTRRRQLPFSIDLNQTITALDDQQQVQQNTSLFSIDLNQTTTMMDAMQTRNVLDGGQKDQEDISPKTTTTIDVTQVTNVLNEQYNNQDHMVPFSLDLNQTITIIDTMQSRDGVDDIYMEDDDQHRFG